VNADIVELLEKVRKNNASILDKRENIDMNMTAILDLIEETNKLPIWSWRRRGRLLTDIGRRLRFIRRLSLEKDFAYTDNALAITSALEKNMRGSREHHRASRRGDQKTPDIGSDQQGSRRGSGPAERIRTVDPER